MTDRLTWAVAAMRDEAGETLSDATRTKIVEAAWQEARDGAEAFRPAFRPAGWLAVLGILPTAAVILLAVVSVNGPEDEAMFTGAAKNGDEVVFTIADGPGPHKVVKSTDPRVFNPSAGAATEQGVYTDRANSGPVIVFYRID